MRNARLGWVVLCTITALWGCRTPSQDWNGTWRLDPSKSTFQGRARAITVSISADGEYHYDDGFVQNTFRCDGEYRPIENNRTQACVRTSATTLDRTRMENGVKTNKYHWELSAGGKVFTATATTFRPGGPVVTGQLVATRISGSDDFAGEWQDTGFLQRRPELTLRFDSQYLHFSYPSGGSYVDAPLNGADAPMYGPNALPGTTYAVRPGGQHELLILEKHNGNAFAQESLKLSEDGEVIIDSWSNPTRPADKATLVYGKR